MAAAGRHDQLVVDRRTIGIQQAQHHLAAAAEGSGGQGDGANAARKGWKHDEAAALIVLSQTAFADALAGQDSRGVDDGHRDGQTVVAEIDVAAFQKDAAGAHILGSTAIDDRSAQIGNLKLSDNNKVRSQGGVMDPCDINITGPAYSARVDDAGGRHGDVLIINKKAAEGAQIQGPGYGTDVHAIAVDRER